ncbi:MAG TPA: ABC transporter permease [Sphaerochaeta sp.]|jgi:peptide/nickel transport system permease protein|nr:ABC transporter permease [Sphaerochaeta sp.]
MIKEATSIKKPEVFVSESFFRKALTRFFRHKLAVVGLVVLTFIALMSIFYPMLSDKTKAFAIDYTVINKSPHGNHILGTDALGRDVLMRLMLGGRVSLSVGFVAAICSMIIGVTLGGIAGFFGGKIDMVIMRLTDTIMCFPFLVICMVLVSILGPGLGNTILAIAALKWTNAARITRAETLRLREMQFAEADKVLGINKYKTLFFHIIPNAISPIIVNTTFTMADTIMTEASLSFLGLGVSLPTPTWGNMLRDASDLVILKTMPWLWVTPGIMIALTVLSINFIGDGLRDSLDPRMNI